jgi:uncharacterized protein DUF4124
MKSAAAVVLLACGFLLAYSPMADAELWRCADKEGATVFTDRPSEMRGCQPHSYDSGVSPQSVKKKTTLSQQSNEFLSGPGTAYPFSDYATPATAQLEKFRGISPGMTESEVLALAGYPYDRLRLPCGVEAGAHAFCPKRWLYNDGDKWIVDVTLDTGRVTDIKKIPRQ